MGYQPIYDGEFDLAVGPDEITDFLESITRHKIVLTGWLTSGPAGGNPLVKLRGTRRQFMGWFNDYYDPEFDAFQRVASDADTWANALEAYLLVFVA